MDTNLKFERAKEVLVLLNIEIDAFLKSRPYRVGAIREEDQRLSYVLTKVDDCQPRVSILIGDIIQNLRSTLDHIAYKLFTLNSEGLGKHIYFPIASDRVKYESEKIRKTEGMSETAKQLIDSVEPYKEGNKILWQIHELNNIDKHRTLITSGSSFHSVDVGAHMMKMMRDSFGAGIEQFPEIPLFIRPADNLFPLQLEQVLFVDGPGADPIPNMSFKFQLVLNEPGIAEGTEVTTLLEAMCNEVEKQIKLFNPLVTI